MKERVDVKMREGRAGKWRDVNERGERRGANGNYEGHYGQVDYDQKEGSRFTEINVNL